MNTKTNSAAPQEADHIKCLVPDSKNARQHSPKNIGVIADSLHAVGAARSIVIDENNIVLAGNGVLEAAGQSGITKLKIVDVDGETLVAVRRTGLTDKMKARLALDDNRASELSDWNEAELQKLLLNFNPDELKSMAFSEQDMKNLGMMPESGGADAGPKIDKAAELQKQWGTATGQLWSIGSHRLLCGDSTKREDVERVMGGGKADMVFTDPPYGVAYVGKTKDALTVENDDVDETTLAKMCKEWFDRAQEASRPGAYWLATVPSRPLHKVFLDDWKKRGILRQIMVWNKDSMVLGHSEYHYKHEPILFGWVEGGERLKNPDRTRTTVWDFDRPKASREHPTMKPVEMWQYGIQNHSNPGDLIYEPFLGSGTTMVSAENLKRKCFGLEISQNYAAVILQRMQDSFPNLEIKKLA